MSTPFPFELVLAFTAMAVCMWIGVFLRAKIAFLQSFLVPASLTGGILGLILYNFGLIPLEARIFQTIAYHLFIISFISIGLSTTSSTGKGVGKQVVQGSVWMALQNTFSMSTQVLLGLGICAVLGVLGYELHPKFGYLLSLGFTQGPGQALAIGSAFEQHMGFAHGINLGLTFAALGFLFAFGIGVPLARWGIGRGISAQGKADLPAYVRHGYHKQGEPMEEAGRLPVHAGNVDSFAFQFGAIAIVYGLTYLGFYLTNRFLFPLTNAWGFFFSWALLTAFLFQFLLRRLGVMYLIDQGLQRRISGWAVDYMVMATIVAISLPVVWNYIVPVTIIALLGGLWTFAFGYYFGKRIRPLGFERMLAIYGANSGTMASGLLLLRIVDPNFATTVNMECGSYVLVVTPAITACLVIMLYVQSMPLAVAIYAGMMILSLILLKLLKMWNEPADWRHPLPTANPESAK